MVDSIPAGKMKSSAVALEQTLALAVFVVQRHGSSFATPRLEFAPVEKTTGLLQLDFSETALHWLVRLGSPR